MAAMNKTRVKKAAMIVAAQDKTEAAAHIRRIGDLAREVKRLETELGDKKAALEQQYAQWTGMSLDVAQIVGRARSGDKAAFTILDRFVDCFAQAVASAVALLDPQVIVIGGGLASIDELYTTGVHRLHGLVFCDRYETPVLRNQLGNSAGVVGAAMIGI